MRTTMGACPQIQLARGSETMPNPNTSRSCYPQGDAPVRCLYFTNILLGLVADSNWLKGVKGVYVNQLT